MKKTITNNGSHLNVYYDSYSDFVANWEGQADKQHLRCGEWYGCQSADPLAYYRNLAANGDANMANLVERAIGRIESRVVLDNAHDKQYSLDVAGAYPSVPDYLCGSPEHMYAPVETESKRAVRVFVNLGCSSSVTAEQMASRGAAIVALVQCLQRIQPVSLYAYDTSGSNKYACVLNVIPIDVTTLSVQHIAGMFAHVGFVRSIIHAVLFGSCNFNGQWPAGVKADGFMEDAPLPFTRMILGCTEDDIVVNGAYYNTRSMDDPEGWVIDTLRKQGVSIED